MHYLDYLLAGLVIYVITIGLFFLSAKIEKDEQGVYIINPNSWHFKVAYPFLRLEGELKMYSVLQSFGICGYCTKLATMLYIGWPILALWETVMTLIQLPICLLFGLTARPSLKVMVDENSGPFTLKYERYWLPKIGNKTIYPIYPALVIGYVSWIFFDPLVAAIFTTCVFTVCIAVFCVVSYLWFKRSENKAVSLARVYLVSLKDSVCPRARLKNS